MDFFFWFFIYLMQMPGAGDHVGEPSQYDPVCPASYDALIAASQGLLAQRQDGADPLPGDYTEDDFPVSDASKT